MKKTPSSAHQDKVGVSVGRGRQLQDLIWTWPKELLQSMNPESSRPVVTLVLESGQKFERLPVEAEDQSLADFLDQVLKDLEVWFVYHLRLLACKYVLFRSGGGPVGQSNEPQLLCHVSLSKQNPLAR